MSQNIFRQKSLEHISSPEKLDEYLKTSSPSIWLLLAALALILAGAAAWCFLGVMPTTALGSSLQIDSGVICYISAPEAYTIQPGMEIRVTLDNGDILTGEVTQVGQSLSSEEAAAQAQMPWMAASLPGDWVSPVSLRLSEGEQIPAGALCSTQIVLEQCRPIDLLLGR